MEGLEARDTWTVFRMTGKFVEGFAALRTIGPVVSALGSPRKEPGEPACDLGAEI